MKIRATFIAAAILCLFAMPALPEPGGESVADIFRHVDGYDFRKTRWGMTPAEVIKSEDLIIRKNFTVNIDGTPYENGNIEYVANTNAYSISITYNFEKNILVMVNVRLNKDLAPKKEHMENLVNIRRAIIGAYGQPRGEYTNGSDTDGFLMSSQWQTDRAYIFLTLYESGRNEYLFSVDYTENSYFDRQSAGAP